MDDSGYSYFIDDNIYKISGFYVLLCFFVLLTGFPVNILYIDTIFTGFLGYVFYYVSSYDPPFPINIFYILTQYLQDFWVICFIMFL